MKIGLTTCAALLLAGCADRKPDYFNGYAEADYVRLAAPVAGTLVKLYLNRGDQVDANEPAFILEQENERAAREEATFRVRQAQAQLDNLEKGKRPDEVHAVREQLNQAEAAQRLSASNLQRQRKLLADRFIAPAAVDEARSAAQRDSARVNEMHAQLRLAQLGARSDEIEAAREALKAAQAQLAQADWVLAHKTQRVPVRSEVADVLYREGEFVPAGAPVVSLLPPQNIKLRFFVPEAMLGMLRTGQDIKVHCDGCANDLQAKISYVSSTPEYTSPLIYSKETRSSLVFMIEARPASAQAAALHPGQPVEVRLAGGQRNE
jgi:HlyD family secretion protein